MNYYVVVFFLRQHKPHAECLHTGGCLEAKWYAFINPLVPGVQQIKIRKPAFSLTWLNL